MISPRPPPHPPPLFQPPAAPAPAPAAAAAAGPRFKVALLGASGGIGQPLGLLLNETVDLKTNKAVLGVVEQEGAIIVRARTSTNRNNSNITLMFTAPNIELRQWTVKDAQGGNTTVALRNLQPGATLDPALFAVPVKAPRQASNNR